MKAKRRPTSKQTYSADRPIQSKRYDILGRAKFAERLANDLHAWGGSDSLVVGLYGAWGSGKSSLKNMLLEANRQKGRVPLPVVDFNPWQLSGTGGIPASFFRELALALNQEGPERDIEKRAKKLNAYAATLSVIGTTAELAGKTLPWAGIPGGPLLETLGTGMKSAGASAKEGGEALKAQGEAATKSLESQKRDLARLLTRLPQPLLVVIDDIDRLSTAEILQVFQLVKANADFPRVVYVLLFEREVVAKALNEISGGKGMEFLEKIIQVGYHVPHASRTAVQKVLFTGLDTHLDEKPVSKYWNKDRWRDLYVDGIAHYFQNLRHVYRFLASFAFHVRHHRAQSSFEVNPVDLIGLETLRVFEPAVYEKLPGAKTLLTRYEGPSIFGEIEQKVVDQAISQIAAAASPEKQPKVVAILNMLFPPISSAYSGKNEVSRSHEEWLRELRVCHPQLFDKYFTLTIADDDLSQAELDNLIAAMADAKSFRRVCEALKKRNLLKVAFERLDAYKEQIPLENMPSLTLALCDMGDSMPAQSHRRFDQLFRHDVSVYAWRLCYFGLRREPDVKKRFHVLKETIAQSTGLALPFELVNLDDRVANREAQGHKFLLDEEDVEILKALCVSKFKEAAKGPEFRRNSQIRDILLRWSFWEQADEVKKLIATQLRVPADAAWLLAVLLGESHSYGREHTVRYSLTLGFVERFSDTTRLESLLRQVETKTLTKRETIAVREFKKALKRRAEGKPDSIEQTFEDPDEEVVE